RERSDQRALVSPKVSEESRGASQQVQAPVVQLPELETKGPASQKGLGKREVLPRHGYDDAIQIIHPRFVLIVSCSDRLPAPAHLPWQLLDLALCVRVKWETRA